MPQDRPSKPYKSIMSDSTAVADPAPAPAPTNDAAPENESMFTPTFFKGGAAGMGGYLTWNYWKLSRNPAPPIMRNGEIDARLLSWGRIKRFGGYIGDGLDVGLTTGMVVDDLSKGHKTDAVADASSGIGSYFTMKVGEKIAARAFTWLGERWAGAEAGALAAGAAGVETGPADVIVAAVGGVVGAIVGQVAIDWAARETISHVKSWLGMTPQPA